MTTPPIDSSRNKARGADSLHLLHQQVLEFGEVVGGYIGDGAHLHAGFAPINPLIAELCTPQRLGIGLGGRPHEDVDEMLAPRVDQHGNGAAVNHIEPAALQRKSLTHKVVDRRSEIELAIKPRLHRVLVARLHVLQMSRLKRTEMRIYYGGGQCCFTSVPSKDGQQAPTQKYSKKKSGGHGEPAPGTRVSNGHNRGASGAAKLRLQLLAQRERSALVQAGALDRRAQIFVRLESGDAVDAGNQVTLEIGGACGVQFAIQIAVEDGFNELTAHGGPPAFFARSLA